MRTLVQPMPIVSRAGGSANSAKVKVIFFTTEHLLTAVSDVHSFRENNSQLSNAHAWSHHLRTYTSHLCWEPTTVSSYASDGKFSGKRQEVPAGRIQDNGSLFCNRFSPNPPPPY